LKIFRTSTPRIAQRTFNYQERERERERERESKFCVIHFSGFFDE